LLILFATVGVYRWSRILTGRTAIAAWRADEMQGTEWYRRAIRAHMNCVENLPIYTAIVVALLAARVTSPVLDGLAIVILLARICQSLIHLLMEQTNTVASTLGVIARAPAGLSRPPAQTALTTMQWVRDGSWSKVSSRSAV